MEILPTAPDLSYSNSLQWSHEFSFMEIRRKTISKNNCMKVLQWSHEFSFMEIFITAPNPKNSFSASMEP